MVFMFESIIVWFSKVYLLYNMLYQYLFYMSVCYLVYMIDILRIYLLLRQEMDL